MLKIDLKDASLSVKLAEHIKISFLARSKLLKFMVLLMDCPHDQ